jgi:hypothetical protein
MRLPDPISVCPELSEPDRLSSRVLSFKVLSVLEIDPYSGPTFLDVLPDAPPLWKSPWLLLPKVPLLPIALADLSMLGIEARGTDGVE